MTRATPAPAARTRSRIALIIIMGLFLAPVVLAWLVFFVFPQWRPTATINHGELVTPVRPLPAFSLQAADGRPIDETILRGKWTLVYLQQGDCDESCLERLVTIRQVRLAQGKNIDRLQRLLFWRGAAAGRGAVSALQKTFPGLVILELPPDASPVIQKVFQLDDANPFNANSFYLVDPMGNVMMRYPPGIPPEGAIKDLERLLKYSGLG